MRGGSASQSVSLAMRSVTNGRDNNEDCLLVLPFVPVLGGAPIVALMVADGMGGHAYGEHASREALRKIAESLFDELVIAPALGRAEQLEAVTTGALEAALWSALMLANAHVRRMAQVNHWGTAGSTTAVALATGTTAIVANLGDSPCFHYAQATGALSRVTEEHTVAGALLRAGMISDEMARFHEGRGRLELYVGAERLPAEPPVHTVALVPGDLLLLCSDGVSGRLEDDAIGSVLSALDTDLERGADELLALAREAGETDNQTLILWRHAGPAGAMSLPRKTVPEAPLFMSSLTGEEP